MAGATDRTSRSAEAGSSPLASPRQEGAEEIRTQHLDDAPPLSALRHFLWGWSRLALGIVQMGLSVWAAALLIAEGFSVRVLFLIAAATLATATSRFLFRGREGPTT